MSVEPQLDKPEPRFPPDLDSFFASRPSRDSIKRARPDVMLAVREEFWLQGPFAIIPAAKLVAWVRARGHTLAATLYAIQDCIWADELRALPRTSDEESWSPWCDVNIFVSDQFPASAGKSSLRAGPFQLVVDEVRRVIIRQGIPKPLDLMGSQVGWAIFKAVFDANGSELDQKRFQSRYEGAGHSWDGRHQAVRELNGLLGTLGLQIKNWSFHSVPPTQKVLRKRR